MISFWGLLYLLFITAVLAYFSYALFFRKEELQDSTPVQRKIQYLRKHIPPTHSNGWQLWAVANGLRIWQKNMSSSSPLWIPETVYACSGIIPASQQEVYDVLKQPSLLMEWDPFVKTVSKVSMATDHDVISLSFNCSNIIARAVQQIREAFGEETKAIFSRHWEMDAKPTPEAWLMSSYSSQAIPAEGTLWCFFLLSSVDSDDDGGTDSLLTLVVGPVSPMFASIPRLTASRVAGLQDFFTHYKPGMSSIDSGNSESSVPTLSSSTPDGSPNLDTGVSLGLVEFCKSEATVTASSSATADEGDSLMDNVSSASLQQMLQKTEHTGPDSSRLPDFASSLNLQNLIQKLYTLYEGTEGTDGWISVGKFKGVDILKRPAKDKERPWDTLKGTSVVCVPIHYVLGYINSMDFRGDWDDLFLKGEVVEEYEPLTLKVAYMEYKPVWPTTARDFCTLVHLRQLSEAEFCMACEAVEYEKCAERKGLVRADLVVGGFVVKELNTDPPSCVVSYITRVDLKGNLPIRLVNKVTSSQPQAVAALRDKLEALYQADLTSNGDDVSQIGKEGVDLWRKLTGGKEAVPEEKGSMSEWSSTGKDSEKESVRSLSMTSSETSVSSEEVFPITEENMQLPFVDRHNIDFRTFGSQAVANLLGEVLLADRVEIPSSKEFREDLCTEGDWSYQGTEKDIAILRKNSPGKKIHSFLGKGIIKVKPTAVWQAIRNHMTRHVYDKMLKKIQVVKQIDDQSKILYLHLQARQCIVKQARDFVILTTDREESEKYVQASVSVQLAELPPSKDITRAKVHCCGWIIEPLQDNGQLHSMVSYLVQVDFGGIVPAMLMNLVARRQPLCIAYLRDYLEKSQN